MRIDVLFYLEGTPDENAGVFSTPESPLIIGLKKLDFYTPRAKAKALDGLFILSTPDSELIQDDLHVQAQEALRFRAGSLLSYDGCNLQGNKARAFREISDFFSASNISNYMTIRDEEGEEKLVRGSNPQARIAIQNDELIQPEPSIQY